MKFMVVTTDESAEIYAFCPSLLHGDAVASALNSRFYPAGIKFKVVQVPEDLPKK